MQDDKGETTILAVHSKDTPTSTYTPKQLKWTEITIPDQWKTYITQPPRNFEQRTITSITEQYDGKILLKFGSLETHHLQKSVHIIHVRLSPITGLAKLVLNPKKV